MEIDSPEKVERIPEYTTKEYTPDITPAKPSPVEPEPSPTPSPLERLYAIGASASPKGTPTRFRELAGYEATPEQKVDPSYETPAPQVPTEPISTGVPDLISTGRPDVGPSSFTEEVAPHKLQFEEPDEPVVPPPLSPLPEETRRPFKEGIVPEEQRRGRAEAETLVRRQRREGVLQQRREALEPEPQEDIDIEGAEMKVDPSYETPPPKVPTEPISTGVPDPISTGRPDVAPSSFTEEVAPQKLQFKDPGEPFFVRKPARSIEALGDDEPFAVSKPKKRVVKKPRPPAQVGRESIRTAIEQRSKAVRESVLAKARVAQPPPPQPAQASAPQTIAPAVKRPETKKKIRDTRLLFKAGLEAVRKQQRKVGFVSKPLPSSPIVAKKALSITRAEPITVAPSLPPRKPSAEPEGIRMAPKMKAKRTSASAPMEKKFVQPQLKVGQATASYKPERKKLEAAKASVSFPVKKQPKRRLVARKTSASFPKPSSPKAKPAPKAPKAKPSSPRRVRFADSKMQVAPTQQVTVTPTQQSTSSGMSGLAGKIDELLRNQRDAKRKTAKKKAYSSAKKTYKSYRKKAMDNVKKENKEIKKRETAKIKKLPAKQRAAARKTLKEALKQRVDKVRKQLPTKIETSGQLKGLMSAFRTLKV
jgi:hypothetical protein